MQIEIQIPKAVLFDVKYTVEQATNFAKKEVALGFYMQKGVSVALCSQIAGMSEKEFLVEVKDVIQICRARWKDLRALCRSWDNPSLQP